MKKRKLLCACAALAFVLGFPSGAGAAGGTVYDVTEYRAIPDNGIDDTAEFQKVLDFAKGSDGVVTVKVPEGTYDLTGTLDVYSNTHIILEEGARLVTTGGDVFRGAHTGEDGNACSNRDAGCSHGMYTQTRNVVIEGGEITSSGRDEYTSAGYIVFSHGQNITLRDMVISGNCSHAIRFYGCRDVTVKGCTVKDNHATYARKDAGAFESVQLGDNCADATEGYPYPHDDSKTVNASIVGCTFENVITGIGNHANCPMAEGVLIEGCVFRNVGGDHGTWPGNGSGYGIDLSTVSGAVVRGNVISMNRNGYAAVLSTLWEEGTSRRNLIEGNLIIAASSRGITLMNGACAKVFHNTIFNLRDSSCRGKEIKIENAFAGLRGNLVPDLSIRKFVSLMKEIFAVQFHI